VALTLQYTRNVAHVYSTELSHQVSTIYSSALYSLSKTVDNTSGSGIQTTKNAHLMKEYSDMFTL
jgi:hypothetical protein